MEDQNFLGIFVLRRQQELLFPEKYTHKCQQNYSNFLHIGFSMDFIKEVAIQ